MTLRYAHLAPAHKVKAVDILNAAINGKQTAQWVHKKEVASPWPWLTTSWFLLVELNGIELVVGRNRPSACRSDRSHHLRRWIKLVELNGIEPSASWMPFKRSPSWATAPPDLKSIKIPKRILIPQRELLTHHKVFERFQPTACRFDRSPSWATAPLWNFLTWRKRDCQFNFFLILCNTSPSPLMPACVKPLRRRQGRGFGWGWRGIF